jgi:hypothetical protein
LTSQFLTSALDTSMCRTPPSPPPSARFRAHTASSSALPVAKRAQVCSDAEAM